MRKMQCAGVAVGGNKVRGCFSDEEQCCGGVAVWGVFVRGDVLLGSCVVEVLQCGGVAV